MILVLATRAWAQSDAAQLPPAPRSSTPEAAGSRVSEAGPSEGGGAAERVKPGLSGIQNLDAMNLPGSVDPAVYRVGPGDVLLLQLWGNVSRSLSIEVGPEGMVMVPGAGSLKVDGSTLAEVRESVLALLSGQFRGVHMDVRLARPRVFRIYLTGQVRNPGAVLATGSSRIADVLNPGALLGNASSRRIEIIHRGGGRELADLGLFLATGSAAQNPWLRDGDVVSVPVATDFIHVQGAVARPGDYELGADDSLLTLLRLAGDPIPSAYVDRALLIHWRDALIAESLWVDLRDVYSRRVNPRLEEGERLYLSFVPGYHQQKEAAIVGEVERPGTYPISEGYTRLSNLLHSAEGFLPSADLASIRVHRRNPNEGDNDPELERLLRLSRGDLTNSEYAVLRTKLAGLREDYRVDWARLMEDPAHLDLLLRGGDIVRVERLVLSIRVDGEVRQPGILSFKPGRSWMDYVQQAGGFTDRAWAGKTRVIRAANGQTMQAKSVNTLNPGDFVWVPEKPDVTVWQQAQSVLTSLAYVGTIIIAIRSIR